ncbi:MAG: hypothetical protein CMJ42_16600 [Phyllobacteriaceae bacterium]|nr:hypothetical protein [Phyllobacteriaceae bacterium]
MRNLKNLFYTLLGLALLAQIACNDPTVIGSDLFTGDQLDIEFTDTVSLKAYALEGDSVLTYSPIVVGTDTRSFLFGDFVDPVLGRVKSTIYFQVGLNTIVPSFENAVLDSVLLLLPYQKDGVYGDLGSIYQMEVYQLDEQLYRDSVYYSSQSFKVRNAPAGFHPFVPDYLDSLTIFEPSQDTSVKYPPHLRVPLNENFGNFLLNTDPTNYSTDSAFYALLPGFELRPISQNPGMLSFDLRGFPAGLKLYYHQDTSKLEYTFPIFSSNVVTTHFEHDYTGSAVEPFLNNPPEESDSLLFIQGASGMDVIVEFPYVENLKDLIVNKAELVLYPQRLPGDNELDYDYVDQLIASEAVGDSIFVLIDDVEFALNRAGSSFGQIFGGELEDDNTYRLNISGHFQDMISGNKSNRMLITVYNKAQKASRSVITGPNHSAFPMKLRLTVTRY